MEKCCKERDVPGRMIPVRRAISAGCGLAWCAPLDSERQVRAVMDQVGLRAEAMHQCMV